MTQNAHDLGLLRNISTLAKSKMYHVTLSLSRCLFLSLSLSLSVSLSLSLYLSLSISHTHTQFWKVYKRLSQNSVILIPFTLNCCIQTLTFFFPKSPTSPTLPWLLVSCHPTWKLLSSNSPIVKPLRQKKISWQKCSEKLPTSFKLAISV